MRRRRRDRQTDDPPGISLTPLIDIVLVLLIFVVFLLPPFEGRQTAITLVNIPDAICDCMAPRPPLIVHVSDSRNMCVYTDGYKGGVKRGLVPVLTAMNNVRLNDNRALVVAVFTDFHADVQDLVRTIDVLRREGYPLELSAHRQFTDLQNLPTIIGCVDLSVELT